MSSPQQAVNEVLLQHIRGKSALWGERVQPLMTASATLTMPYVIFFPAASGRRQSVPSRDHHEFVMTVKAVGKDLQTVLSMESDLSDLLHASGRQDINPRLPLHPEWYILTVAEGRSVFMEEKFAGAESIYHAGHQYAILLERKA
jgi:hypothetical protein